MDHTLLPANYNMPAFTPQPQSITTLWLVLIYRPTEGRRLSRPDDHNSSQLKVSLHDATLHFWLNYFITRRDAVYLGTHCNWIFYICIIGEK